MYLERIKALQVRGELACVFVSKKALPTTPAHKESVQLAMKQFGTESYCKEQG
jgi:hypothetical protein